MTVFEIEISYPKSRKVSTNQITQSRDAESIIRPIWQGIDVMESAYVIHLNNANYVTGIHKISSGGITSTIIDVRLILSVALKSLSVAIIMAHNHPSGNLKPSNADISITNKIKEACNIMDIKLLDHLILAPDNRYFSFGDEGMI